ncbi:MAG: pyrroloquinoline quinone biosynthesis protein PqqE, partial [Rhodoferax sp.]
PGFNAFRGETWMKDPCRSCDERHKDFGGCRCQAYLLTGDAAAADPVCSKSPHHEKVVSIVRAAAARIADEPARSADWQPLVFRTDRNSRALSAALTLPDIG